MLRCVYREVGLRTRNVFKRVFGQSVNLSMQEYIVLFFLFYILVSLAGIFVLPRIFSAEFLVRLIKAVNFFETNGRDNLFFHLVKPLVRLGVHPNVITGIGFLLVGMLATSFWRPISPASFFVIALFAGLSDMFDGMLARASGKITSLGGALDGIRDFFLFSVLTIAAINKDYLPIKYILAFLIGAICVEIFKLVEIVIRGQNGGLVNSFRRRTGGEGKLSIDRAKFFFYISALLAFFLADAFLPSIQNLGFIFFGLAVASAAASISFHGILFALRNQAD